MRKKLRKTKDSSRTVVIVKCSASKVVIPGRGIDEVNDITPMPEELFHYDNFSASTLRLNCTEQNLFEPPSVNCLPNYTEGNEISVKELYSVEPRLFFTVISLPEPTLREPALLVQNTVQTPPPVASPPVIENLVEKKPLKLTETDKSLLLIRRTNRLKNPQLNTTISGSYDRAQIMRMSTGLISENDALKTKPENSKIHLVVDAILKLDTCSFTKGQVTNVLKNKKMKAAEIGTVLTFLVQEKALQRENTIAGSQGGRPAEQYSIIYGNSSYFKKDK